MKAPAHAASACPAWHLSKPARSLTAAAAALLADVRTLDASAPFTGSFSAMLTNSALSRPGVEISGTVMPGNKSDTALVNCPSESLQIRGDVAGSQTPFDDPT